MREKELTVLCEEYGMILNHLDTGIWAEAGFHPVQ